LTIESEIYSRLWCTHCELVSLFLVVKFHCKMMLSGELSAAPLRSVFLHRPGLSIVSAQGKHPVV